MSLPSPVADAARKVLWSPQPGPQTLLVQCPCFEVFYGGARGGGKTDGSIGDWLIHSALYGENAIGIFVRRKLDQLREVIARTRKLFSKIGATYNIQQKEWTMPGGARLRFVYLDRDEDAENYQGHSYTRIYVEEATNFPSPGPIHKLKGALRSANGVPCGIRLTGNPGGPGHQWVRQRYIDNGPFKVVTETEQVEVDDQILELEIDRVFIPAKLKDNKELLRNDPGYILRLRQTGSAALVKAWLEGLWDAVDGAFFSEWDPDRHVLRGADLEIPSWWPRFRSFDWGSAKPFSCGWYAVSDGSKDWAARGAIIRYDEWYGCQERVESGKRVMIPNTGLKMTAGNVGLGIKSRETQPVAYGVADPSIFITNGGPSIAELMASAACYWIRADNSRKAGWAQVRQRLGPDRPMLLVHERCEAFLRTVPYLQHDDKDLEDLDTDAEDHVADEVRYAVMSRVGAQDQPRPPVIKMPARPQDLTIGQHLARQKQRSAQGRSAW